MHAVTKMEEIGAPSFWHDAYSHAGVHTGLMEWSTYVRRVIGNDKQVDVARKTGIDQTTISRWLNPERGAARISSQSVAAFARGYERPVLEAFVVAGFLTEREAGIVPNPPPPLEGVPSDELIAELHRRVAE